MTQSPKTPEEWASWAWEKVNSDEVEDEDSDEIVIKALRLYGIQERRRALEEAAETAQKYVELNYHSGLASWSYDSWNACRYRIAGETIRNNIRKIIDREDKE